MLNFITGRKGSGKTSLGHKILGDAVTNGDAAMLIVPKQFTFESDRGVLKIMSPRLACRVEVLSFGRLCQTALQCYGGIKKNIARDGVRAILMSVAIDSVSEQLETFSKHKNEISLSVRMLAQLDEMKNQGITCEDLIGSAEKTDDKILKSKMLETALILKAYESVSSQSFFDEADLLSEVADILRNTDFFNGKTIVIDGFTHFTHGEYKIILEMLKSAKNVYITLCTDGNEADSDLSAFASVNRTLRKLRLLAGNNGIEIGEIISTERSSSYPEDLAFIEKNLFVPDFKVSSASENVSIICCNNIQNECDTVGRKIKALIRQGEYRCRDIAVVFRNGEEYENGIKKALKKYGVPLFEDRRQPVMNQPLICLVRNLLGICSEGFTTDLVFRYCKTGLAGLTVEEISLIENYVFMWDIKGKRWLSDWTENPKGFGHKNDGDSDAVLEQINAIRERIIAPIEKIRSVLEFCQGKKAIKELYLFLRENRIDEELKNYALLLEEKGFFEIALEQEQVWELLMECFDEIATALGENSISAGRLYELFELTVSTKSLGKLPDGFDEVSILSADRALTRNANVVFLVGMNNGVFPLMQSDSGVFSHRERLKIASSGISEFDNLKELTIRERFLCYNALSCATKKLIITYSLSDKEGKDAYKSECVEWVEKILPDVKTIFSSDCDIEDYIESEKSAFEVMARFWNEDNGKINALKEYFFQKPEYRDKLSSIMTALSGEGFRIEGKDTALDIFGKNLHFSSTQLEYYNECPFRYFCRYGLKAKPRIKAELGAADSGTVVHEILEKLLLKYKGREFLNLTDEMIDTEIRQLLDRYIQDYMGGFEEKGERFRYLYNRMHKIIRSIIRRLIDEFTDNDFEMSDFELEIAYDGKVKPFTVALEQGTASFSGVIDRVDRLDLNGKRYIRVVDYKTGVKTFSLSNVLNGMNLQMLLYLISIWRNGEGEYSDIIPSGVLYIPARIVPNNAERGADSEKLKKDRYKLTKMDGMLLEDDEIIRRMDKSLKGIFIPAKYDEKNDCFKGDFISYRQFELLSERLDGYIRQIGDSIHNGLIAAKPLFGLGGKNVCEYCDYKDICMNKAVYPRAAQKLKHSECLEILEGGKTDGEKVD